MSDRIRRLNRRLNAVETLVPKTRKRKELVGHEAAGVKAKISPKKKLKRVRTPEIKLVSLPPKMLEKELALPPPEPVKAKNPKTYEVSRKKLRVKAVYQGNTASCWSVSLAHQVEENACIFGEVKTKDWKLSPQSLINTVADVYDNHLLVQAKEAKKEGDCYQASTDDALHFVKFRGIGRSSEVPYDGTYKGFCAFKCSGFISNYFEVDLAWEPDVIGAVVTRFGCLVGTFLYSEDFNFYEPESIFNGGRSKGELQVLREQQLSWSKPENLEGKEGKEGEEGEDEDDEVVHACHLILITGAGCKDGTPYFKVRHTGGLEWGKMGYGYVDQRLFMVVHGTFGATISDYEAYARSVEVSPHFRRF